MISLAQFEVRRSEEFQRGGSETERKIGSEESGIAGRETSMGGTECNQDRCAWRPRRSRNFEKNARSGIG